jgi:tetratricopeptide (TPR) repeat protein
MRWVALCLFGISICSFAQTSDRQKAVELNGQASQLFSEAYSSKDTARLVIDLLDQAIAADSLYRPAHWNKASLLCQLGQRKEALKTLDRLSAIQPDFIGILSWGGSILEIMGQKEKAKKRYLRDITKCDKIIKRGPDSLKMSAKISKATFLMLLYGKTRGIQEYKKIVKEYSGNKFVKSKRDTFYTFDRKKYLNNVCK